MAHFANWMSRAFHGTLVKLGQDMIEIRFLGYAVFKGNSVSLSCQSGLWPNYNQLVWTIMTPFC